MTAYADHDDFALRYGRTLTASEETRVEALITDAQALVDDATGTTFTTTIPDTVVMVVCEAARRAFDNPAGLQGETIGDYTWRTGYSGTSNSLLSGVYLTPQEKRMVRRAAGVLSAGSVTLSSEGMLPAVWPYTTDPGRK